MPANETALENSLVEPSSVRLSMLLFVAVAVPIAKAYLLPRRTYCQVGVCVSEPLLCFALSISPTVPRARFTRCVVFPSVPASPTACGHALGPCLALAYRPCQWRRLVHQMLIEKTGLENLLQSKQALHTSQRGIFGGCFSLA